MMPRSVTSSRFWLGSTTRPARTIRSNIPVSSGADWLFACPTCELVDLLHTREPRTSLAPQRGPLAPGRDRGGWVTPTPSHETGEQWSAGRFADGLVAQIK